MEETILSVHLFGRFRVCIDGQDILVTGRRSDRLLAYLVLHDGWNDKEAVLSAICGYGDESPLHHACDKLRSFLGKDNVLVASRRIKIDMQVQSDVAQFDSSIKSQDLTQVENACSLYKTILPGWKNTEDNWLEEERRVREEYYLLGVEKLNTHYRRTDASMKRKMLLYKAIEIHPIWRLGWQHLYQCLLEQGEIAEVEKLMNLYNEKRIVEPSLPEWEKLEMKAPKVSQTQVINGEPKGPLLPQDKRYVVRPMDEQFENAIHNGARTILLKGPQETGKTSALARQIHLAKAVGFRSHCTNFDTWTDKDFIDIAVFSQRLLENLLTDLGLWERREEFIIPKLPPEESLTYALSEILMYLAPQRLLWSMDGLDRIFLTEFRDTFFGHLRYWHSQHALTPERWSGLTLILLCTQEPYLHVKNLDQSPFNVGTPIYFSSFTLTECQTLAGLYDLRGLSQGDIESFFAVVGGRPSLLQKIFYMLQQRLLTVEGFLENPAHLFNEHLQRIRSLVESDPAYREVVRQVQKKQPPQNKKAFYLLRSRGIIEGEFFEESYFTCKMYEDHLAKLSP
jgi:DNA-binding SARP family transcriptional activator